MTTEPDNPYLSPASPPASFQHGGFAVKAEGLICGNVVKLPKICLQTGQTDDVVEVHFEAFDERGLWKIRGIAVVLAVIGIATSLGVLLFASASLVQRYQAAFILPMIVGGVALLIGTTGWHIGAPRVKVCGYISQQLRRSMLIKMLMFLITKLPLWIVLSGTVIGSAWRANPIPTFADSWTLPGLIAFAYLCSRILMGLLEYHWKRTRDRGIVLEAKGLDNGLFLVSGFSTVFLGAVTEKEEMAHDEPV
jgi:hypothetical protein